MPHKQEFYSPGYPANYPAKVDCFLVISGLFFFSILLPVLSIKSKWRWICCSRTGLRDPRRLSRHVRHRAQLRLPLRFLGNTGRSPRIFESAGKVLRTDVSSCHHVVGPAPVAPLHDRRQHRVHRFQGRLSIPARPWWVRSRYGTISQRFSRQLTGVHVPTFRIVPAKPDQGSCRFEVTGLDGTFSRTDIPEEMVNHSRHYQVPLDCTWVVTVAETHRVNFTLSVTFFVSSFLFVF